MNAVDIVAGNDVVDHGTDELTVLGLSGVEIEFAVVAYETLRMAVVDMVLRQRLLAVGSHTVRIEPCMKFHATLVALLDHELQWIPERPRGIAAVGQIAAPWFKFTCIECIALRTHLKDYRIDTYFPEAVELADEIGLVLLGVLVFVLSLEDCVKPSSAEFMFGSLRHGHRKGSRGSRRCQDCFNSHGFLIIPFIDYCVGLFQWITARPPMAVSLYSDGIS